jgi:probable F420-dependent oxidoreductase
LLLDDEGAGMKFGLAFANTGPFVAPQAAAELGQAAEAAGIDSLWTVEHVIVPKHYKSTYPYAATGKMAGGHDTPIPDPLIWLTWVGAATTSLKLGTGIVILPQRNPAVLAKEVATLAQLTAGRVLFGVGVGWLEEEFDALGVPFARRGERTDEYIAALRALWAEDDVSFSGEFVSLDGVSTNPKPPGGSVPLVIGGHSKRAARRAGELGDGFFRGKGDLPELIVFVRQTATDAGRDPAAIEITGSHPGLFGDDPRGAIEEAASWGVDRLVIPAFFFAKDVGNLHVTVATYMAPLTE